jgi:hypothetical protein
VTPNDAWRIFLDAKDAHPRISGNGEAGAIAVAREAAKREREAIVAWLRADGTAWLSDMANAIERGVHYGE